MIYVIGNAPQSNKYRPMSWETFCGWAEKQLEIQLDIETNVTDYYSTRKLITIQIGNVGKAGYYCKEQVVLQWSYLDEAQKEWLKSYLQDTKRVKLIHNAKFEYIVLRFHNIVIGNVYDTMLVEKVLMGGLEIEDYALADISFKYCCVEMDKTEQKAFGDDILTEDKVVYAATDVIFLDSIRRMQLLEVSRTKLEVVAALENEAVLAFSDITFNGLKIDKEKWLANIPFAQPIVEDSRLQLDNFIYNEPKLYAKALELGYISKEDRVFLNANSPKQKTLLLQHLFPTITGSSKLVLQKFVRDNAQLPKLTLIAALIAGDSSMLFNEFIVNHREYLIKNHLLIEAGKLEINWNSVDQVLPLAKVLHPKLKDLSAKSLGNTTHPLFTQLELYKDNLKLISTYGETFIEKYVEPDGKVRTNFNQIVSTGRVSSSSPNMQNIPARESVGTRYRNAFVYNEGWWFVDSDFSSQELAIIAYITQDPVWAEAIVNNQDLHSVAAELVFKTKWRAAALPDCSYYKIVDGKMAKQKCKCPGHKSMRNNVKTINFG